MKARLTMKTFCGKTTYGVYYLKSKKTVWCKTYFIASEKLNKANAAKPERK